MSNATRTDAYQVNRSHYDTFWAQRWRRTWNFSSQTKVRRFRWLLRRHGLLPGRQLRVFDQGFGLGLMLFCFDRSCSLAGMELSPQSVEAATQEARRRGYAGADFRVFEPGKAWPAEWRGGFDFVLSSHVLEHMTDPAPALDELLSLLRPGGHACLVVPVNERPGEDIHHFTLFTEATFLELVRSRNLEVLESHVCDRLLNLILPIASAALQRRTVGRQIALLLFNAVFGLMPAVGLRFMDVVLRPFGLRNRQCFVVCRKPA